MISKNSTFNDVERISRETDINPYRIMLNYVAEGNKLSPQLRSEIMDWMLEEFVNTDREYGTMDSSLYHLYKYGSRGLVSLDDDELIQEAKQIDDGEQDPKTFNIDLATSSFYQIITRHFTPIEFLKMVKEYG